MCAMFLSLFGRRGVIFRALFSSSRESMDGAGWWNEMGIGWLESFFLLRSGENKTQTNASTLMFYDPCYVATSFCLARRGLFVA